MRYPKLTRDERSLLVELEQGEKTRFGYGSNPNLPDDCAECGYCGTPFSGGYFGLCPACEGVLKELKSKGETKEPSTIEESRLCQP